MMIWREFTFEAAHWLPLVPEGHKCHRMHGHSYRVRIELTGPHENDGMVLDFADVKAAWKPLHERLDHRCLNDVINNPTSEWLAHYIFHALKSELPLVSAVEVSETASSGARYP